MRASLLLPVLFTMSCERIDTPPARIRLQPFSSIDWTIAPSDEQLVRAMVGVGGSPSQRDEVERLARALLLPVLDAARQQGQLRRDYEDCSEEYRSDALYLRDPVTAFASAAVTMRSGQLNWDTQYLAWARAQHELWPDEPFKKPEVAAIDPTTIDARARALTLAFERMQTLTRDRLPGLFEFRLPIDRNNPYGDEPLIWMIEDNLRAARGEGYGRSNNLLRWQLEEHHVPTSATPGTEW